jgi:hypothetical protein
MLKSVDDFRAAESEAADANSNEEAAADAFMRAVRHDVSVHKGEIKVERNRVGMEAPAKPWFRWYWCPKSGSLSKYPNIPAITFQRKDPVSGDYVDTQEFKGKHQVQGDALLAIVDKQTKQQNANKAAADAKTLAKVEKAAALAAAEKAEASRAKR